MGGWFKRASKHPYVIKKWPLMHRAVLLTSSHIFFPLSEIPVISAKKKPPESIAEYQEKNSKGLIEPPLPFFKNISSNSAKQNVLANVFSSRGARLLNMSKLQKISSSPGSSCSNQDSPTTSSSRFVNLGFFYILVIKNNVFF